MRLLATPIERVPAYSVRNLPAHAVSRTPRTCPKNPKAISRRMPSRSQICPPANIATVNPQNAAPRSSPFVLATIGTGWPERP